MNLGEMTSLIVRRIQDDSFDPWQDIVPMVNASLLKIAAFDGGPFVRVRLPALIATATVTFLAGADNFQPMPENYQHNLFEVKDLSGLSGSWPINVRTSSQVLYDLHGFVYSPGPIQDVAVDGSMFWAMPEVIEDQALQLRYYRKPAVLVNDLDEPEGIPAHLHEDTIVNDVVATIYNLIEEDINENKPNTRLYSQKFAEALAQLVEFCKGTPRKRPVIKRHAGWF